jgi:hypothetical protein
MAGTNDVTGDKLINKRNSDAYRDNWDAIFGKKEVPPPKEEEPTDEPAPE